MGKKLENVKKISKEGTDAFKKGGELGSKAVKDVKSMKRLIDSMPKNVDDEITNAAKAVEQGTKGDAEKYMKDTVSTKIESGRKSMEKSSKEAGDQVSNNEKVKKTFEQMDNVGGFGKSARTEGKTQLENSSKEFNKAIQENAAAEKNADLELKKQLTDISGTF